LLILRFMLLEMHFYCFALSCISYNQLLEDISTWIPCCGYAFSTDEW